MENNEYLVRFVKLPGNDVDYFRSLASSKEAAAKDCRDAQAKGQETELLGIYLKVE